MLPMAADWKEHSEARQGVAPGYGIGSGHLRSCRRCREGVVAHSGPPAAEKLHLPSNAARGAQLGGPGRALQGEPRAGWRRVAACTGGKMLGQ
ncbi:hypothetical protein NDU88_000465 [Pleurodeles waltl]|uniref:Uncharacterized protein n=1 Tax=Pleurodeles waltl TaxID=8319 RepID=A0AAV7TF40_PLEWA|nr:hypothetical protein NDU88_000465 [Pleurodeles waltl]